VAVDRGSDSGAPRHQSGAIRGCSLSAGNENQPAEAVRPPETRTTTAPTTARIPRRDITHPPCPDDPDAAPPRADHNSEQHAPVKAGFNPGAQPRRSRRRNLPTTRPPHISSASFTP